MCKSVQYSLVNISRPSYVCVGSLSPKWFLAVQYNGKSGWVTPYMAVALQSDIFDVLKILLWSFKRAF